MPKHFFFDKNVGKKIYSLTSKKWIEVAQAKPNFQDIPEERANFMVEGFDWTIEDQKSFKGQCEETDFDLVELLK